MTARFLTTALPGDPTRQRAVLTTGTPGLYLWRHREPCPHDDEDGDLRRCPGCRPWEWNVLCACGLTIGRDWPEADSGRRRAAAVADTLGRTGVDWTTRDVVALLDQLTGARRDVVIAVFRGHGMWTPADPAAAVARTRARYAALVGTG